MPKAKQTPETTSFQISVPSPDAWLTQSMSWVDAQPLDAIKVTNAEEERAAGEFVTQLKVFEKTVTEERTKITSGAYKTIKEIEARFRPLLKRIKDARTVIETRMVAYRHAENAAREAALNAARAMAPVVHDMASVREYQDVVAYGAQNLDTKVAGVHFKESWSAVVENPAAVPSTFWVIDQAALDRYAQEHKERAFVPGVRFVRQEVVGQIRTK